MMYSIGEEMGELIRFAPADSRHVKNLDYDVDKEVLHVTFANGARYVHRNVPRHVFADMTDGRSVGTFYHKVIRVHYPMVGPVKQ